jgi:hypothetical protein
MLTIVIVWTQNKPNQNQNTANRGAARKKFTTLKFPQQNINNVITSELPASVNVPAMLMSSFAAWVNTLFPHVSVLVSFARQTNAGTANRRVKVSLANQKKAKIKLTNHNTVILLRQLTRFPRNCTEALAC